MTEVYTGERGGGGGGLTDQSSGYKVMLPLKTFKTKFHSLLVRFIMRSDGKYKYSGFYISIYVFDSELLGGGGVKTLPQPYLFHQACLPTHMLPLYDNHVP